MAIATEQIVVELVADTSSLESAIDQLVKTGAVDQQLANAFKNTTTEINKQAQAVSGISTNLGRQSQQFKTLNDSIRPVSASLDNLSANYAKQGQAASTIKQVSSELSREAEAVKKVRDNAEPAALSLEDLALSAKNLSKDMAAGLQEGITAALDQAGVSIEEFKSKLANVKAGPAFDALNKSLAQTAVRAAETSAELERLRASGGEGSEAFVKLQVQLQADEQELQKIQDEISKLNSVPNPFENVGEGAESAGKSTASLKQQLRQLTEQIVQAKVSGQDIGEGYEALVQRAGRLKDAISDVNQEIASTASDTSNIDGLINAAQGIAGAFAVAQGAAALFGEDSKELQSALVKLNAIMALTQGLQAVGNTLQKESAASRLIDSAATKAQVVAQRAYALVVGQSTGALKLFRIALASTGIGLLIIALGALVANWDAVKEAIFGVSEAQKELANTADLNADQAEEQLEAMEGQEEVLKRQGKTEQEILKAKIAQTEQIIAYREQQLQAQIEMVKGQVEAAQRNKSILAGIINFLTIPLKGLQLAVNKIAEFLGSDFRLPDIGETLSSLIFDPDEVAEDGEKTIAETKKEIDKLNNQRAGFKNTLDAKDKEDAKKRSDAAKAANEQRLKDVVSNIEAELILVKKGSEKELDLQKKLITAKANLDLNGAKSAAERRLIAEKLNADLTQLDVDFQKGRINDKIKGIQDELELVEEGSQKELDLRKKLIDEQAALELNNANLTDAEKDRINQKRLNKKLQLEREFNKKIAAEAIEDQISRNEAELNSIQTTNEDKLLLRISNIELAAEAEVLAANGNAAKIKEIYAKRDAAIRDTKLQFILDAAEYEIEQARRAESEIRNALEKTSQDSSAGFGARIDAVHELTDIEVDEINKRLAALRKAKKEGNITEEDYNKRYGELVDERTAKERQGTDEIGKLHKELRDKIISTTLDGLQTVTNILSSLSEIQSNKDEERIQGLKNTLQAEIDAGAISEKEADRRRKKIDAEEKKAQIKAAERNKQIAIFNAIINTAQAIVQALTLPWPFNLIQAALVGAMGAAQVAAISSRPIPKFKTGKKHLYEGFAEVAEDNRPEIIEKKGGEKYLAEKRSLVWLKKEDKVYTNRETQKMLAQGKPVWVGNKTTNNNYRSVELQKMSLLKPEYKVNKEAMIVNSDNADMVAEMRRNTEILQGLYKTMKGKNGVTIKIDKEGITEFFEKTMSEITYYNNRYSFRK